MKKTAIFTAALGLMAAVSCQEVIMSDRADGAISVHIENSPVVEVITKAESGESTSEVSPDNFKVYIKSTDKSFVMDPYIYKDMPTQITVPAGFYIVSAENVNEQEALAQPDSWGQVRYYGESDSQEVKAGQSATQYNFTCYMVNTALSIDFSEKISTHFKDFKVTAFTDGRNLEYTTSTTDKVGYFTPGTLTYVFTGKYMDETSPMTITGTRTVAKATHLHLTFDISEQNGTVDKPTIIVDASCTDLNTTITVDPSENGSFVENDQANNN